MSFLLVEEEIPKIESALIEKALADYDFSYTNNEDITTGINMSSNNKCSFTFVYNQICKVFPEKQKNFEICFSFPESD